MYELEQGTNRLIKALYNRSNDTAVLKKIADATNYLPEQLKEDIQALYDYYLKTKGNDNDV